ncbi:MAG: sigma-70 family RNA polymerase sigma factor [Chitinophagaceae bacterium]|nr:sigma-70 family RNA polymerase sigma factor [Chitinophagaceae bacterium]
MELTNLIEGCVGNNEKCQKVFYEKYLGFVLKTVYRYVSSYESANEVSNDAFIKIFKSFVKFDYKNAVNPEMLLMAWMRRIIVNTAIDYLRVSQAQKRYQPLAELNENHTEKVVVSSDEKVLYKELIELIKKLSPSYRAVFNMYVIDGYTHQEIAKTLGISVGTSKSNLARARAILQKYLVKDNKDNVLCLT